LQAVIRYFCETDLRIAKGNDLLKGGNLKRFAVSCGTGMICFYAVADYVKLLVVFPKKGRAYIYVM
jgi:hypothetical protein